MKNLKSIILALSLFMLSSSQCLIAQNREDKVTDDTTKMYVIVRNNGEEIYGKIISQSDREILLLTEKMGKVYIPKYEIKEIREIKPEDMDSKGNIKQKEIFATRYFVTTNALPIDKGDNYVQLNLYGADIEFGVAKNLSVGGMTTWIGIPILGTIKYSIPIDKKVGLAFGAIVGTASWALVNQDYVGPKSIALPFAAFTVGDKSANFNISVGYGAVRSKVENFNGSVSIISNETNGRFLMSFGGMKKFGKKVSFVFDSFLIPASGSKEGGGILIPGLRFQTQPNKAFQFGFAGVFSQGVLVPFPIPFVQWYRKI